MSEQESWLEFDEGTTPSGLVGLADGRLLVALRRVGVDARDLGGTEVRVYDPATRAVTASRLLDVAEVHAVNAAADDGFWLTDRGSHTVLGLDADLHETIRLGTPDRASDTGATEAGGNVPHPAGPFNIPTGAAQYGSTLYVADGYANARIHVFEAQNGGPARYLDSFGGFGTGRDEFHLPHAVAVTADERILVCDRENSRIQAFSLDGRPLGTWFVTHRPTDVVCHGEHVYVSDLSARVVRLDLAGREQAVWPVGRSAHNLAVTDTAVYVSHLSTRTVTRIQEETSR